MPAAPETYLRRRGLRPLEWAGVLRAVENRLSTPELEVFRRLHRSFAGYPTEHTCRAFYDFCARSRLLDLLACFRFERLRGIGESLSTLPLRGRKILEIGAGAGYLAGYLREETGAEVAVTDWSEGVRAELREAAFPVFADSRDPALADIEFHFLLCADSLGEIHSDEDDWLREPQNAGNPGYAGEVERRYGFGFKLAPWKPLLRPGGAVYLFEPVPLPHFWRGAAQALESEGWRPEILGPNPVPGLRLSVG